MTGWTQSELEGLLANKTHNLYQRLEGVELNGFTDCRLAMIFKVCSPRAVRHLYCVKRLSGLFAFL